MIFALSTRFAFVLLGAHLAVCYEDAHAVGRPDCSVLSDNSSTPYIYDFTSIAENSTNQYILQGAEDSQYVLEFCSTSKMITNYTNENDQTYHNFGSFDPSTFVTVKGSNRTKYQEYVSGDYPDCYGVNGYYGRHTQVYIHCDGCPVGTECTSSGGSTCICSVNSTDNGCAVSAHMAVECPDASFRLARGFNVGFFPTGKEILFNGWTQYGYAKNDQDEVDQDYSVYAEVSSLALYASTDSTPRSTGAVSVEVDDASGLEVTLRGPLASGTVVDPSQAASLQVDFTCSSAEEKQYYVYFTIPFSSDSDDSDEALPDNLHFTLSKLCSTTSQPSSAQSPPPSTSSSSSEDSDPDNGDDDEDCEGWYGWGIFTFIFVGTLFLFCGVGLWYNIVIEKLVGMDALPGIFFLRDCMDSLTGSESSFVAGSFSSPNPVGGSSVSANFEQKRDTSTSTPDYGGV
ncbi:hypothetical protein CYMTET_18017 [Cymbomonas tetramitiformis]|uniref:Uncharacterized protein n=1 Tax=Cymbomonas tetramitiformis TaxID=36881 RepID=A0AAE0G8X8_9CHLO|nr:hypothetical protein CYMTET_18017 [Cymbomonas tetramitiformis]